MVAAVVEMGSHTVAAQKGGTYGGGFGFQERLGWFLQLGL